MSCALDIVCDIHLIGLRSAVHLNGREGVNRGLDPENKTRCTAVLDDGTCVSVKVREKYRRISW
jgi:hypothetical protein